MKDFSYDECEYSNTTSFSYRACAAKNMTTQFEPLTLDDPEIMQARLWLAVRYARRAVQRVNELEAELALWKISFDMVLGKDVH